MGCRDTERGLTRERGAGAGQKQKAAGIGAACPRTDAHLAEQLSPEASQNAPSRAIRRRRLSLRSSSNIPHFASFDYAPDPSPGGGPAATGPSRAAACLTAGEQGRAAESGKKVETERRLAEICMHREGRSGACSAARLPSSHRSLAPGSSRLGGRCPEPTLPEAPLPCRWRRPTGEGRAARGSARWGSPRETTPCSRGERASHARRASGASAATRLSTTQCRRSCWSLDAWVRARL